MMQKLFPWMMVAIAALTMVPGLRGPSSAPGQPDVHAFGRIPVVNNGRVKPMDTIARTHLRIMSNRETFKDKSGASRSAIEWLLDVEADERESASHPVFRIDHPQLLNSLGLQPKEGFRYSIDDFGAKLQSLGPALETAHRRKEENRPLDAFETQLFEFERHLAYYQRLADFQIPHSIPPRNGKDWLTLKEAVPQSGGVGMDPHVDAWRTMISSYRAKDAAKFNAAVESYLTRMKEERPADLRRAAVETRFNYIDPFNSAKWLYLVGFVLASLAWLGWSKPLNRGAWGLMAFTFIVHTGALIVRMYLSGRPPVTNLYSSAIFIGWGCVLLGLVLELIYKIGIGNIVAAVAGFATLQIAHVLAAEGDTMEVLQAVLDTQFWLATHVTCITLGYATTYVAGLLGLIFI
ncbi:MAG TPA: hypothetical protein VM222_07445, partial [Planctomycetota bacterium]|nr:hypothetical protein [Planctomycetota bacterium]